MWLSIARVLPTSSSIISTRLKWGGRSKDGKQVAGIANGYIASANEEYVLGNKLPLWLFGFLY